MDSIAFANQKGGPGKSSLTTSTAALAHQLGHRVVIIETDPQGSATDWAALRRGTPPLVVRSAGLAIEETLNRLRHEGYDMAFIDTPGENGESVNAVLAASDLTILPCRPNLLDLRGAAPTFKKLQEFGRPAFFVLTQVPTSETRIADAQAFLTRWAGAWTDVPIASRVDHPDAYARGLGVTEHRPKGAAAREVTALFDFILALLTRAE